MATIRKKITHYVQVEDKRIKLLLCLKIVLPEGRKNELGDQVIGFIEDGDMELLCGMLSYQLNVKEYQGRELYVFEEFGEEEEEEEYGMWEEIKLSELSLALEGGGLSKDGNECDFHHWLLE